MSAQPLQFPPLIQDAINHGVLTPATAWITQWEWEVAPQEPWTPAAQKVVQLLNLHVWTPQGKEH